jgi:hypothetical protein
VEETKSLLVDHLCIYDLSIRINAQKIEEYKHDDGGKVLSLVMFALHRFEIDESN